MRVIVGRRVVAVALLYAVMLAGCATEGTTRILSYYGDRTGVLGGGDRVLGQLHSGLDFAVVIGDPVIAAADGMVARLIENMGCVIIQHRMSNTFYRTVYCHMDQIDVTPGQNVKRGDGLGKAGTAGAGRSGAIPHLHFELWQGQPPRHVDPLPFIVGCFDPVKTVAYSALETGEGKPRPVLTYPVRCARTQWGK